MTKLWASLKARGPGLVNDAIGVAGGVVVVHGVGLIYKPAAFILGGLALVTVSWLLAKRAG